MIHNCLLIFNCNRDVMNDIFDIYLIVLNVLLNIFLVSCCEWLAHGAHFFKRINICSFFTNNTLLMNTLWRGRAQYPKRILYPEEEANLLHCSTSPYGECIPCVVCSVPRTVHYVLINYVKSVVQSSRSHN